MEPLTRRPNLSHTPLALIIAMLIATPVLATDFTAPQVFTAASGQPHALAQSRVDIPDNGPAISVQGTDFSLRDVLLRNAGSGGALQALGGAALSATTLDAETLGASSPAIRVDGSDLQLSDSSLVTRGILSQGIHLGAQSGLLVQRTTIETFEASSTGILEESNALSGSVSDSAIHTHKAESAGVGMTDSGPLALINTRIVTEGTGSEGVTLRNNSRAALSQGSNVHTLGDNAAALASAYGSALSMSDGTLFTEGSRATGAWARNSSSIDLQRTQVLSAGTQAPALEIDGDSRISVLEGSVANVDGGTARFTGSSGVGQLSLTDTALTGQQALIETTGGSHGQATVQGTRLNSSGGAAFAVAADSTLAADLSGSTVDAPILASVAGNGQLALAADGSSLRGNTFLQDPSRGRLDMDLHSGNWSFDSHSAVSNLKLQDATVFFRGTGYQVLTVNGDLSGNGKFQMKTDLSSSQGDLLQVLGQAQGSHEILVADSGRDAQGAPLKLVGTGGGAGQFSLLGGHVDAGAFRYGLQQQGNDWYLVQKGQLAPMLALTPSKQPQQVPVPNGSSIPMTTLTPAMLPQKVPVPTGSTLPMTALTPSLPPQRVPQPNGSSIPMTALTPSMPAQLLPQPQVKPDTQPMTALTPAQQTTLTTSVPSVAMSTLTPATRPTHQAQRLSSGANAALGMQTAAANLWQSELGTLTRRLGELRQGHDQGGLWTRAMGDRMNVDTGDSRAFEQSLSGAEIGADRAFEQTDGTLYVGGMFGAGHADQDFGEHSSGDLDSRSIGLYVTWLREDGWYLDSVLKYDHLRGEVKVPTNIGGQVRGHCDSDAYGASVEVGRTLQLGQGWFVEPQVQLSGAHLQGPQYTSSDELEVDGDAVDSVQARAGGRAGRNWQLDSGAQLQGYLSASWIDELAGESTVKVNGHELDNQLPGSRAELGAGGSLLVSAHQKLMVEVHYANGHEIEQPLSLTLGYRYLW
ncbi:autotransporter outer membrane beta-barrel domain-containing protein [Pseudomonas nitroreducens]|uniref:Autotransporter outer membrane beta-barrel domain-containing protein n=1 Tax=Pseudomonas nitroreducens TaxID=46680 RepID=A0A5R9A056_PSENT|nr:autotransporter outer membrane beta-barrel domain-containing protein [Pseudomonas nitroreducens]TLP71554.1 autotransporter outer membrane beta-barrel domain-containing protein [Pseudomonas nitroreducens]